MTRPTRATSAGRAYLDLQNRARREKRGTQELLIMYVVERWLARLSRSHFADDFVLKGGMLLAAFGTRRPTVDADALARHMATDEVLLVRRVSEVAAIPDPDDGVEFLTDTVTTAQIRDAALYAGIRVTMRAQLATAQVKFQLDVNFGDPITPEPRRVELPALRPGTAPIRVLGYPVETVLAEKLVTAMDLAQANTRVRDFADMYELTGNQVLTSSMVREALEATAGFRGVELIPLKEATRGMARLRDATYTAYRRNLGAVGADLPEEFADAIGAVVAFIDPVVAGEVDGAQWQPVTRRWMSRLEAANAG